MENIIDKIKENKKMVIIIAAAVLVALAATISVIAISHSKKPDEKENLSEVLKSLGSSFYEDFYYLNIGSTDEERATKLERYSSIGIKVDVDNLSRYNTEKVKDDIAKFDKCDKTSSKVIIYPKSPYGQKDYEIEVKLECDFEK